MAIQQHRVLGWVWRGISDGDMRTGFIEMTRAELTAAIAENRAQDPRRTTSLQLKHISNVPFVIPRQGPAPTPTPAPTPAPYHPARRRRGSSDA
jgi:hypothetical protein